MANLNLKPNNVLIRPRITEKAAIQAAQSNVHVFEVSKEATKKSVIASMKAVYKVTPLKVRFAAIPKKSVYVRGKWGTKGGGKKAYVYLKKGDKIEN